MKSTLHCGFMDSRLCRFPPNRASAVPYGQTVENALRFPPLAHRSAAAHKLHSAHPITFKIRESQNHHPTTDLSLFQPGGCPSYRDHGKAKLAEIAQASEEAWESIKDGVESAWASMKSAFSEAAAKRKK
jgi:hypothetical protein